ncbi:MAG: radical SAM protein [Candidatus Omnitrophota bacterium]|jgi:radical SAM superfamily enzyme YgiQ (UPF0313 family)
MISVILVNPLHRFGKGVFNDPALPLSLLTAASPLDNAGYSIKIIDQQVQSGWKKILLTELKKGALCVGVTCMTGPQIRYALEISKIVKQNSSIPVIWGGTHPSLLPVQTLENENIDIVVQGEGEETFLELVGALKNKTSLDTVKGICYKQNNKIKQNPSRPFVDLNNQPPLAYYLIDIDKYLEKRFQYRAIRTFSSRGCTYNCSFCYNQSFNLGKWRALTADETIKRVKELAETYKINSIIFCDDNFFNDIPRAREILKRFASQQLGLTLFKIDIRPDTLFSLDDETLKLLKQSGCLNVAIGLESGSERILKLLNKNITVAQILVVNQRLKALGIIPSYTFMVGYPTETLQEVKETITLILRLIREYPQIIKKLHIYTPLPGTELFDSSIRNGLILPQKLQDWIRFNYRTINLPWLSKEMWGLLRMLNFCSIFLEYNSFFNPEIRMSPFVRLAARLYRPIARWRVEKLIWRFPLEMKLADWLGFYRRQV